jgi:hypothetical protein
VQSGGGCRKGRGQNYVCNVSKCKNEKNKTNKKEISAVQPLGPPKNKKKSCATNSKLYIYMHKYLLKYFCFKNL